MPLNHHKTAASVATEIRMTRVHHDCAFLLLEGADDGRFWAGRVRETCGLLIAGGRSTLLDALAIIDARPIAGVVAVADPDYDSLQGTLPASANLVFTDAHDLETTLASIGALRRVVYEFGDAAKISAFEQRKSDPVALALAKLTAEFGRFRWLNVRRAAPVSMEWLKPKAYLDIRDLSISRTRLARDAVSAGLAPDPTTLANELAALPAADPWLVAQGHDLLEVVTVALRRVLGSLPSTRGVNDVASALRLAADGQELANTNMVQGIQAWQTGQGHYVVLR
jgi:hypothetical protein